MKWSNQNEIEQIMAKVTHLKIRKPRRTKQEISSSGSSADPCPATQ